mmetsp:Transcript_7423/g.9408  ORF Transcript_7423/g.9408 Transcript_7423/m.9408 type:complete len:93 (+) Transcript_7423:545-823(+)
MCQYSVLEKSRSDIKHACPICETHTYENITQLVGGKYSSQAVKCDHKLYFDYVGTAGEVVCDGCNEEFYWNYLEAECIGDGNAKCIQMRSWT